MTKTEKLANAIEKEAVKHLEEIDNLEFSGPRGGRNARFISGWTHSPHGTITAACNLTPNVPTAKYWSGFAATPASAIPSCIYDFCVREYDRIFDKELLKKTQYEAASRATVKFIEKDENCKWYEISGKHYGTECEFENEVFGRYTDGTIVDAENCPLTPGDWQTIAVNDLID